tara:strand:+ start:246 stop:1028 length:783 start_codon:yes stop_codon:yes gene_type:complete
MTLPFETYYINMKKDKTKNDHIINTLNKTNLKYKRFEGIPGSQCKDTDYYKKKTNLFCKLFSTDKIIGCGLTHIKLIEDIYHKNNTPYAFIIEDDILLLKDKNFDYNYEINKIINYYNLTNPKWELIKLHSFHLGLGSTAAYIVNRKGMEKIVNTKLNYHIDIQFNNFLNVIIHENLFSTKDIYTDYEDIFQNYFIENNQKIGFYLNSHAIKLLNINLKFIHIIIYLIFLVTLRGFKHTKKISQVGSFLFFILFIKCIFG